jgi:hypothetical protein
MTVHHIDDLKTPIGDLLRAAGADGVLLESAGETRYALMPLDDDLIDFLIERSPKFIEQCREIQKRMQAGKLRTHEEIKKLFNS